MSPKSVKLNIDCQEVAEKEIKPAGNTSMDGFQVLGKMSKSIGSKGESATVSSNVETLNTLYINKGSETRFQKLFLVLQRNFK